MIVHIICNCNLALLHEFMAELEKLTGLKAG